MLRKTLAVICLTVLIGGGCAKKAVAPSSAPPMDKGSTRNYVVMETIRSVSAASRYLAVRHKLVVVAAETEVPKSLEAVIAFCGTIQCEVVSSNVASQTVDAAPSGSVSLRVRPPDVDK